MKKISGSILKRSKDDPQWDSCPTGVHAKIISQISVRKQFQKLNIICFRVIFEFVTDVLGVFF